MIGYFVKVIIVKTFKFAEQIRRQVLILLFIYTIEIDVKDV